MAESAHVDETLLAEIHDAFNSRDVDRIAGFSRTRSSRRRAGRILTGGNTRAGRRSGRSSPSVSRGSLYTFKDRKIVYKDTFWKSPER